MIKSFILALVLTQSIFVSLAMAGSQFYKCNVNGTILYQEVPCQSHEVRRPPTVEELNAARQKQLTQGKENQKSQPLTGHQFDSPGTFEKERENIPVTPTSSFKCDGRKFCSQMTSCSEAKYFLSNCPGVKMDGNGDGTPCEKQWCRP
jgi:hypothetical protein